MYEMTPNKMVQPDWKTSEREERASEKLRRNNYGIIIFVV
jgi:hypothetical protein